MAELTALVLTLINIALAIRTVWREWRRPVGAHPLEAAVRDIAAALREGAV